MPRAKTKRPNAFTSRRAIVRGERVYATAIRESPIAVPNLGVSSFSPFPVAAAVGASIGDEIAVLPGIAVPAGVSLSVGIAATNTINVVVMNNSGADFTVTAALWRFVVRTYRFTS